MYHPWRILREHFPDVEMVCDHQPDDGDAAWTEWGPSGITITIDRRLPQATRRSVLAHELEHVTRGPLCGHPVLDAREELSVDRAAARRLITIEQLAHAASWSTDLHELADELWVHPEVVRTRLESLTKEESIWLETRLDQIESSMPG